MSTGQSFNAKSACGSYSACSVDKRLTFRGLALLPPYWIYVILEAPMLSSKYVSCWGK